MMESWNYELINMETGRSAKEKAPVYALTEISAIAWKYTNEMVIKKYISLNTT